MKRVFIVCLFHLFATALLVAQSIQSKQIGSWIITPPHLTYPQNTATTARLASISTPSVSLVLQAKPYGDNRGSKPRIMLSILMENSDGILREEGESPKDPSHDFEPNPQSAGEGVPVKMSFDGEKSITRNWAGGGGMIEYRTDMWTSPSSSDYFPEVKLAVKIRDSKTLKISYPTRSGHATRPDGFATASFDLSGAEAVFASICPPDGCQMLP
jgi:hypothetical protein